jgi:hypothetical protein
MKQKRILVAFAIGALVIAGGVARAALKAPATSRSASPATDMAHAALGLHTAQAGGGENEGIAVHGAWTIKVLSPDGQLVSSTSFENSYNPTTILPDVLARNGGIGFWEIGVMGNASAPCTNAAGNPSPCAITEPGGWEGGPNVFKTLVVSAPHSGADAFKLVLSGSATAQRDSSIDYVNTLAQLCTNSDYALNSPCGPAGLATTGNFTQRTLATSIPVVTGQQILVTVIISFS